MHGKSSIQRRRKWISCRINCPQVAHKLFWNVYTWLVLVGLIFYVQWTNLHVLWRNGQKLVINASHVWSHTFITHVNTGNIVMWWTQDNIADGDCLKTLILQETLKIPSQYLEEFCTFLEVKRLYRKVGCARNLSFTQFYWSWNHFSLDAGSRMDGISRSRSLGYSDWSMSFRTEPNRWTQERATVTSAVVKSNMQSPIPINHTNVILTNIWSHSIKHNGFWSQFSVERPWGQRSRD